MTDKFRRTEPVSITFSDGEQPTASKLKAIVTQSRNGSQLIEKAVGDIWNQSGDTIMTGYPLQINNLGRTIGQVRYLNPPLYATVNTFVYRDSIGTLNTGRTDGYLQLKPSSGLTIVGGSTAITSIVASEDLVDATGEIYIDITTGRFKSFNALTANDKLDYTVDTTEWSAGFEQVPSIIPDPRQVTYTACRVSTSGGKFYIHLPPRRPLNITGHEKPERYPSSTDYTANEATVIGAPRKLWQSGSSDALGEEHYRYTLSKEVRDTISSLAVGDALPGGLIQLYDQVAGTIIEDVVFKKSATAWVFEISSVSTSFTSKVSASEVQASYNNTGYTIITSGTSVSRAVIGLQKAIYGTHNNNGNFSSVINHSDLRYLNPASNNANYSASAFATWAPSRWGAGDEHTSLLSRAGSWGTAGTKHRDVNDNGMLGDLLMTSATISGGNYLNVTNSSRRIYFGSVVAGPSIHYDSVKSSLTINGLASGGKGLYVVGGGSSVGIFASGGTGGTGTAAYGIDGAGGVNSAGVHGTGNGTNVEGAGVYGEGNFTNGGIGIYGLGGGLAGSHGVVGSGGPLGGRGGSFTGTGVYDGIVCTSGSGATGAAGYFTAVSTNGNGITTLGNGTGAGIQATNSGSGAAGQFTSSSGSTGNAITAQANGATSGYVLSMSGNAVTPPMRIVPQGSVPSGASQVGDLYMNATGILKVCTGAGTGGGATWVSVGAQV